MPRMIDYKELKRQCELNGTGDTCVHLTEAIEQKRMKPDDFSIRDLAEAFMGTEWLNSLRPKSGRYRMSREIGEAVAYGDFAAITGQIIFSKYLEGYQDEAFVFTKEIPTVKSDIQDMEKIPGLTNIGDEILTVTEGHAYPYVGFSQDWIEVAAKQKRGMIVALTKEAIFGDRTGQILTNAKKLGFYAGLNLEKRCIDAIVDENAGAVSAALGGHRYHWKGTSYATYQTATPFDNVTTSNGLANYTDVENALLTIQAITDPYTGEPVSIVCRDIIVTPQNFMTARNIIFNTQDVRVHSGGYNTSGELVDTGVSNPLGGMGFKLLSSQLLASRTATDTDWWLGNVKEAINRYVNWDLDTEEAAPNHPDHFLKDIVMQVKVSLKDAVSVVQPRALHESRA